MYSSREITGVQKLDGLNYGKNFVFNSMNVIYGLLQILQYFIAKRGHRCVFSLVVSKPTPQSQIALPSSFPVVKTMVASLLQEDRGRTSGDSILHITELRL